MMQEYEELNTQQIPQSIIAQISSRLQQPYKLLSDVTLDLSTTTDQLMLNGMIKKLLIDDKQQQGETEVIENTVFDFLVCDKLLRGNLKSHLIRYGISPEQTIQIHYFISFSHLSEGKKLQTSDWVSCIQIIDSLATQAGNPNGNLIVGMYNGCIQVQSKTTKKKNNKSPQYQVCTDPIKAMKTVISPLENVHYVITGGLAEELYITTYNSSQKQVNNQFKNQGKNQHEGSILTIDSNPILDGHFCTAGSQGSLNIWKIPEDFLEGQPQIKTKDKKRKQANHKKANFITTQNLSQNQNILTSKWATTSQIIIGCSDHAIKIVDVQKMVAQRFYLTKDSVTTNLDYSSSRNVILSSHEDGYLRSWDLRTNNTQPTSTFKGHSKYLSCVQYCPTSSNIFASGAYDSTVNIWDARSVFPLQTINLTYDKVFAIKWKTEKCIAIGGSNPQVNYFQV